MKITHDQKRKDTAYLEEAILEIGDLINVAWGDLYEDEAGVSLADQI